MTKLEAITQVERATEAAMQAAIVYIQNDLAPTAPQARKIINDTLTKLGCESPEGVIVANGKVGALPHGNGRGKIKKGEPIVIDIYPRSKKTKYFADMSRTVCLGSAPNKLQKMYMAVDEAQELARAMIRPGVRGEEIQHAVEDYFEKKGFKRIKPRTKGKGWLAKEGFIHGVGHGVGKEIHEAPRLSHGDDILEEGDIVTIEPGLYYKDIGGVRLEDMVVVTKRGSKTITKFPKKLRI
jgi:Xaa-Pro aminopeptidase